MPQQWESNNYTVEVRLETPTIWEILGILIGAASLAKTIEQGGYKGKHRRKKTRKLYRRGKRLE